MLPSNLAAPSAPPPPPEGKAAANAPPRSYHPRLAGRSSRDAPRSRRGGQARSWGAAEQYGFTLGETVYVGRNDAPDNRRSCVLRTLARPRRDDYNAGSDRCVPLMGDVER